VIAVTGFTIGTNTPQHDNRPDVSELLLFLNCFFEITHRNTASVTSINPTTNIIQLERRQINLQEKLMDDSTSSTSPNHPVRSLFLDAPHETPDMEKAISNLIEQVVPKHSPQIENNVERIRSSIARLSSVSIDGLQGLTSELQELQTFLNSEVSRVQAEIESALSGIKIIIETIAPWKSPPISPVSPTRATSFHSGRIKSRDQG
jgi:hypothetical protein